MRHAWLQLALLALLLAPAYSEPTNKAKVKTIFDYKQELALTDQQVASMKAALVELNESVKTGRTNLNQLEAEYKALLAKEGTTMDEARSKLQQIADSTVALRLKDLEISRKITATLSAEQQKKWRGIQAQMRSQSKP